MPTRRETEVPSFIPAIAQPTVQDILDKHPSIGSYETYGHAAVIFATAAYATELDETEEAKIETLRVAAEKLIHQFGPNIIDFMRPELREALELPQKNE